MSGLKARDIAFSPFSIKRALEQSALFLNGIEVFAQGHGLIQVDRAFEHLVAYHNHQERDVRFDITIDNTGGGPPMKGIYMRDTSVLKSQEFYVNVQPIFLNNDERDADSKIKFNLHLSLACEASWVKIPKHFNLMFMTRGFSIKVDPTQLPSGIHYAWYLKNSSFFYGFKFQILYFILV